MSETDPVPEPLSESLEELRARAESLEQRLTESRKDADARLIRAELKVEAVRAGMIDLDGLKLLDPSALRLSDRGELDGAAQLMAQMKRSKPWLFGGTSTSSAAHAPPAQAPRSKLATEMTEEEYREARAALLRRYA